MSLEQVMLSGCEFFELKKKEFLDSLESRCIMYIFVFAQRPQAKTPNSKLVVFLESKKLYHTNHEQHQRFAAEFIAQRRCPFNVKLLAVYPDGSGSIAWVLTKSGPVWAISKDLR